ncbi:MAG: cell division protein SepF [Synechococcaceae cyanobacterium]|nr:cell division protein SepF [Synechococcaceae cyanobacterium]
MSSFSRRGAEPAGDDALPSPGGDPGEGFDLSWSLPAADATAPAPFPPAEPFSAGFAEDPPPARPRVVPLTGRSPEGAGGVLLMEPRSFDELPRAIQALREGRTVILNLQVMEPSQAQRAVDFVAGGSFAIDGHQERAGESVFLFTPGTVRVTVAGGEPLQAA